MPNSAKVIINEVDGSFSVPSLLKGICAVSLETVRGPYGQEDEIITSWARFREKYWPECATLDVPTLAKRAIENISLSLDLLTFKRSCFYRGLFRCLIGGLKLFLWHSCIIFKKVVSCTWVMWFAFNPHPCIAALNVHQPLRKEGPQVSPYAVGGDLEGGF